MTRDRTKVVQARRREVVRVQGVLERATIKLAAVATAIMGVSGRVILAALVEGRADPAMIAALAKGGMRRKIPGLEQTLTGLMWDHRRRLLVLPLAHIDLLDEQMETLHAKIARCLMVLDPAELPATGDAAAHPAASLPHSYERAITLLGTIPGVERRGAVVWVAETGLDMARFGTASRLAAWARVAPGNDTSAGKRR